MKYGIAAILALALGVWVSYQAALYGAPQQQWLWCHVLKVCQTPPPYVCTAQQKEAGECL